MGATKAGGCLLVQLMELTMLMDEIEGLGPPARPGEIDEYLTTAELARLLKVGAEQVRHWHRNGYGPRAIRFERRLRFAKADVIAWLAARREEKAR